MNDSNPKRRQLLLKQKGLCNKCKLAFYDKEDLDKHYNQIHYKEKTIIKHNRYINIILAIILLISIIWWVVDEEKDNQKERILTQGILEYQAYVEGSDKYIGLLPTVTKLYNELEECKNGNN